MVYMRKDEIERNNNQATNPATLDHLVTYYYLHGSYSEPILKPSNLQGRNIYIIIIIKEWPQQPTLKGTISLGVSEEEERQEITEN